MGSQNFKYVAPYLKNKAKKILKMLGTKIQNLLFLSLCHFMAKLYTKAELLNRPAIYMPVSIIKIQPKSLS